MRRKIILNLIIILIILVISILIYPKKENKILNTSTINDKNNMLSIMVEKEAGTGNYEETTNFPSTGYYLNKKLSKCVNGNKISFSDGNLLVKGNKSDRCYAYFDKDELGSICKGQNMAECFMKNYKKDSSIIYHDGTADYEGMINFELEAEDFSYRYTGSNDIVHNYVCFGSDAEVCPYNNLFRIIGLFDEDNSGKYNVKLIAADYLIDDLSGTNGAYIEPFPYATDYYIGKNDLTKIGGYAFNNVTNNNNWKESNLNTITLNQNYLSFFNKDWQNMIENHAWQVGGASFENLVYKGAKVAYNYELGSLQNDKKTINSYIGLMYISDYYYAALSDYWLYPGYTINICVGDCYCKIVNYNWLFLGLWEYLITPLTSSDIIGIGQVGDVPFTAVTGWDGNRPTVRAVFYLKPEIKLKSGNGTFENPYRLQLN